MAGRGDESGWVIGANGIQHPEAWIVIGQRTPQIVKLNALAGGDGLGSDVIDSAVQTQRPDGDFRDGHMKQGGIIGI